VVFVDKYVLTVIYQTVYSGDNGTLHHRGSHVPLITVENIPDHFHSTQILSASAVLDRVCAYFFL